MIKRHLLATASAIVLALAVAVPPASAQWIVFDPNNFSQNILTAARELQQVNNQIQMLTNQATMLVNQARNLANLPMSTLTQLQSSITQTQSLLGQAQNIAFNVQRVEQAYSTSYGTAAGTGAASTMVANAQTRWQNSVGAFEDSLKVAGLSEPKRDRCASSGAGRQSTPGASIPAALRPGGGAVRQGAGRRAGTGA
jgi:P-type conjugative transfer protein TrbJ